MLKKTIRHWKNRLWALSHARAMEPLFKDVRAYCMFVGYPRSGHTLCGALLDAHPDIVMATELNALEYVRRGIPRSHLYALLLDRQQWFHRIGANWSGYNYAVPDSWQGRHRNLYVIGDKKGGSSAARLSRLPKLLDKVRATVGVPLRLVHVVRNPFDNIARMIRRKGQPVDVVLERYFRMARTSYELSQTVKPEEMLTLRLEDLIADPRARLRELVEFVGVEPDDEYLARCASIVFSSPRRSRDAIEWTPALRATVEREMAKYPFFHGYTFES